MGGDAVAQAAAHLSVRHLTKHFLRTKGMLRKVLGTVRAVDDVSFDIPRGETLSLVGESGCGKTTTGRCILRAIEPTSGEVLFSVDGAPSVSMTELEPASLREVRKGMAMICQDPYSSLDPRMDVLSIVGEPLVIHGVARSRKDLEERVATLLRMVRLEPDYMSRYPHAFSGGQRQRIAIARALAMEPRFIVADEPVSALDVSVQAQVLNLLGELQERLGLTFLFVSHNLAVVEYVSNRIAIMYVGKLVELADARTLFRNPRHPYTEALLSAVPNPDPAVRGTKKRMILAGDIADPADPPPGCYFHPRCPYVRDVCRERQPGLEDVSADPARPHAVACHFARELSLVGISVPDGKMPRHRTAQGGL
jgi:peptide/nickel transport system ATP-binding protein